MKKVQGELVLMFMEDGEPVGFLWENGKREIYICKRAGKEHVAELLEADTVHETQPSAK